MRLTPDDSQVVVRVEEEAGMAAGAGPSRDPVAAETAIEAIGADRGWSIAPNPDRLRKSFSFKTFREAFVAASRVADIADALDHHPDLIVSWGRLDIEIRTHDRDAITGFDIEFVRNVEDALSG